MSPAGLPTRLRTLWYMRGDQIAAELRERVLGPHRTRRRAEETPSLRVARLATPPLAGVKSHRQGRARGWNDGALAPAEIESIHAFGWLGSEELRPADRLGAMLDWIAHHPRGAGWNTVPTSRRVLAWLTGLVTPGMLPAPSATHGRVLPSLCDQLLVLEARNEPQRCAHERLLRLLALASAAVWLEGGPALRWLGFLPQLTEELGRQLGPDGAHLDRSPTLHAELLAALLDLLNALGSAPDVASGAVCDQMRTAAAAMLGAHATWVHPDGEVALLGDSTLGVAPRLSALGDYAQALGVAPLPPAVAGVLPSAGVVRLEQGPFTVIFAAAPPSPASHPAHAHCDALSFELSIEGTRVVVDTGAAELLSGAARAQVRATRAHATVEVAGAEQAELWGDDRIGGRPDVGVLRTDASAVEAVCAGWSTPAVLHRRRLALEDGALVIEDRFDQPARRARLVLPLAPELSVALEGGEAWLSLPRGRRLRVTLPAAASWRVERAPCFLWFGEPQERPVLVGEAQDLAAADWRMALARS